MNRSHLLHALRAAVEAGDAILDVYHSDFEIEHKDDSSPLTIADKRSHEIIVERLSRIDTLFPVLSEEGRAVPYSERSRWDTFWLIDPLDGTKEFIKRNGEFTVNIALIRKGQPIMGVVYAPVLNVCYFGQEGSGAYKIENVAAIREAGELAMLVNQSQRLPIPRSEGRPFTLVGSRSHMSAETEELFQALKKEHGDIDILAMGSSLKLCMIAQGRADIYPRLAPTMQWDIAAGQAIVEQAGGRVIVWGTHERLMYNREHLINPWFIAICGSRKINIRTDVLPNV